MKNTRRIRRMSRNKKKLAGLNLTSLMDVFTILVFFLLFNSSASEVLESPREIKLPDSVVEAKPRETVVIMVSPEVVLVQGEAVISTPELLESGHETIAASQNRRVTRLRNGPEQAQGNCLPDSSKFLLLRAYR